MDIQCKTESGLQVLARLIQPPSLISLNYHLFPYGPQKSQVIEVLYDNHCPQTILVCDLISNAILPTEYGGKGSSVAVLVSDGHFNIHILSKILENKIKNYCNNSEDVKQRILEQSLRCVRVMRVYNSLEMFITIQSLENYLTINNNISLVVVDTVSAFYWSDRLDGFGIMKMDLYVKKILKAIQTITKEYKSIILYTKPSYFVSKKGLLDKCANENLFEEINYKVKVEKSKLTNTTHNVFDVKVSSFKETVLKQFYFSNDYDIYWL